MTDFVPLVLVALVGFSILRAVLPTRVRVQRHAEGAWELRRPLGRCVLDVARSGFWIALCLSFFLASWWTEFVLGALVGGMVVVVLVSRAVDRVWRSTVVINRLRNQVLVGERRVGRTSDVCAVALSRYEREPLALLFGEPDQPERRWRIPGVDRTSAASVGQQLAEYLGVPLVPDP